ncbi:glycosyltransferase [Paracoccus sp. SCSIO 75233]|uniref:glycosyltransferase n=1 Tax=Paracoccus sp. SCSIO 75233 TaxID=3017782 RepID=UPI0022F091FB|nr:glycosyltransferase [Paracoccus sp. SCSIO 75233]WBU52510.1 glycosyltransferase family 2 protein [Paracoccus sp. SCSIO 75233]
MVSADRQDRLAAEGLAGMSFGWFRRWKHDRRIARARAEIAGRDFEPAAHGLDAPLIVSLTSYAARFPAVVMVLESLSRQTVRPDRIILWLDEEDRDALPDRIGQMGVEVKFCPNWKSYKKIVPTLLEAPDSYIVTADDDVYYGPDWLAALVGRASAGVVCHRAHEVVLDNTGQPQSYQAWRRNMDAPAAGKLVFPTGVGGVLYAPGVFHPDVTDAAKFQRLAPSADDVWLYWMHRMAGSLPEKIGGKFRIVEWPGSQARNLRSGNLTGDGNDRAVAAMLREYGWPG